MFTRRSVVAWSAVELADVVTLSWSEFELKYPHRSFGNWRSRRHILKTEGVVFPDGRTQGARSAKPTVAIDIANPVEPISDEKLWQLFDLQRELGAARYAAGVQNEITVRIDTDRPIGVAFMSDFHLGSTGVDHRALLDDIKLINSCSHLTAFVGGDGVDNMVVGKLASVHRDSGSASPDLQYLALGRVFKLLLPNLLAIGTGNHDAWTKKLCGIDGMPLAIGDKPIVNVGERSIINLYVGEQLYVLSRKHRPNNRSMYNDSHAVQQMWRHGPVNFDVGEIEHEHNPTLSWFRGHGLDRLAIRTGTYKTEDSFASEYTHDDGGGIGTPVVVFSPHERHMTPFLSLVDAIEFLEIRS